MLVARTEKKDIREFARRTLFWSPYIGYGYHVTVDGTVTILWTENVEIAISWQIKHLQSIDPSTVGE